MKTIEMPNAVRKILYTLHSNGYNAHIVGGCVRDSLLGITPKDWDITTNATTDHMLKVFKDFRVIETGLQHGTITVVVEGTPFEITTYRIDGKYTDNRRPDTVTFTDNLVEDLARRDFTINAMAYNDEDGLIDPFDGEWDLENKLIKCVGNATERFNEDALRILRCMRFSMRFNFTIHNYTKIGMIGSMELLRNISTERIQSELNEILLHTNLKNITKLHESRILEFIIPELTPLFTTTQNNPHHMYNVGMHTLYALAVADNDLVIKLAVLLHDIAKDDCKTTGEDGVDHFYRHALFGSDKCIEILKRLKYSNDIVSKVTELVLYHDIELILTKKYVKKWLNKLGIEQFNNLLRVKLADAHAHSTHSIDNKLDVIYQIEELLEEVELEEECFSIADLDITGKDILELGYPQGRVIGEILNLLLEHVMEYPEHNNKEELIDIIKNSDIIKNIFK